MQQNVDNTQNKTLVIGILGARMGTGNMGVGALAMGAVTVAKAAYPDSRLFILEYDDEPCTTRCSVSGQTIEVPIVNIRFSKNLFLKNHIVRLLLLAVLARIAPLKSLRSFIEKRNPRLAEIVKADLCLSIAGGDSFADIYGVERFFYIALPQILCLLLKIPLVQLPQTYGPFKSGLVRGVAAWILSRSATIFSRDREGIAQVRAMLVKSSPGKEVVFSPDVGFVLEPRKPESLTRDFESMLDRHAGNLVGINISGLLWMGGYTRDNMFRLGISYPAFTRRLIRYFADERHTAVLLVPHVVAVGRSREGDDSICQEVYDELHSEMGDRLLLCPAPFDQNGIKYLIGKTSFFIGARMHACIAALSQSIPAVGIAYSKKFKGVFSSVGLPELVVETSRQTEDGLITAIGVLYDQRTVFAATLRESMPGITGQVKGLLKELSL